MPENDLIKLEALMKEANIIDLKDMEKMWWIPCIGELFFINLENSEGLHRAERITGKEEEVRIKLIDIGEEITYEKSGEDFYVMPENIQELPPLAKKYEWTGNNVTGCENFDKLSFLHTSIYQKFDFEVTSDHNAVNIWSIPKEAEDDENEKLRKILSAEDHLSTENAMIAIQGFSTRDDEKRCMHYNRETKGCFKKGRCKLNHVLELEEGVYRDKKEIFYSNQFPQTLPRVSALYEIKIIAFSSFTRFFCHIIDDEFYDGKNFQNLCKDINDQKEVAGYQKLRCLPACGELVMVFHANAYYRGKVLDLCDLNSCVPVFLVDEGNVLESVHIKSLYEYCSRFSAYPFFAIEMEIANIAAKTEIENDGIDRMMEMQKESNFKALIM